MESHHAKRVYLRRLRDRHHVLHCEDGVRVDPAKGARPYDKGPGYVAVVKERVAHGEVAVELGEEKGQHVHPEERGQNVVRPVARGISLLDVEEAQIVDREAGQGVADARVQHEYEAVLASQGPGAGDPDDHRAGDEHGACGEQDVEDEDEEVFRSVEVH